MGVLLDARLTRSHAPTTKQLRDRNIGHQAALRQLANRLVGILHGCLKTHTPYNEHTAWNHHIQRPPLDTRRTWDVCRFRASRKGDPFRRLRLIVREPSLGWNTAHCVPSSLEGSR